MKYFVSTYDGQASAGVDSPKNFAHYIATDVAPYSFGDSKDLEKRGEKFRQFKVDTPRAGFCIKTKGGLFVTLSPQNAQNKMLINGLNDKQIEAVKAYACQTLLGAMSIPLLIGRVNTKYEMLLTGKGTVQLHCLDLSDPEHPKLIMDTEYMRFFKRGSSRIIPIARSTIEIDLSSITDATNLEEFTPSVKSQTLFYQQAFEALEEGEDGKPMTLNKREKEFFGTSKTYSRAQWLQDNPTIYPALNAVAARFDTQTDRMRTNNMNASFKRMDEPRNHSLARLVAFQIITGCAMLGAAFYFGLPLSTTCIMVLGAIMLPIVTMALGNALMNTCCRPDQNNTRTGLKSNNQDCEVITKLR